MKKLLFVISFIILMFNSEQFAQNSISNIEVLSSSNGRFVFGQISQMRRDQYMLDTKTGRLWQIVANEEKVISLQQVYYTSLDGARTIEPEDTETQIMNFNKLIKEYNKTHPQDGSNKK